MNMETKDLPPNTLDGLPQISIVDALATSRTVVNGKILREL